MSQKAREGSIGAVKTFELLGDALGVALNNASYLFNPQKIILFGSFCKHSDLFLEKTKSKLFELMGDDAPEVAISKFDDTAAAIGATLFAADLFVKEFEF
ncbi:MAG: ROK family protein [Clostridia bacterium]|nr:ROK family protein [Clostridia bacterium]